MCHHNTLMYTSIGKVGNSFRRERTRLKLALADLQFLETCRKGRLIPKFIVLHGNQPSRRCLRIVQHARLKILRARISTLRSKIAAIERRVYTMHLLISRTAHPLLWNRLDTSTWHQSTRAYDQKSYVHRKKLSRLRLNKENALSTKEVSDNIRTVSAHKHSTKRSVSETERPVEDFSQHRDTSHGHSSAADLVNNSNGNAGCYCLNVFCKRSCSEDTNGGKEPLLNSPPVEDIASDSNAYLSSVSFGVIPACTPAGEISHPTLLNTCPQSSSISSSSGLLRLAARPNNPRVLNLSRSVIPPPQLKLLQKGLNFALTPRHCPVEEVISCTESAIRKCPPIERSCIRNEVVSILKNCKPVRPNFSSEEVKSLAELRKNQEIVIMKADKGGATVILDAKDYSAKVSTLLQGPEYTKVKTDPTNSVLSNLRTLVKNSTFLSESDKRLVAPSSATAPRFYAVPKVHKTTIPLRPIVSYRGCPTYNLAKFLAKLISPFIGNTPHHLKNSSDFVKRLPRTVSENDIFISFDVQNLFTCTPANDAINCLEDRLKSASTFSDEKIKEIVTLTRFCTNSTYFNSCDGFFKQSSGLPMGSPLSPPLCNIFMESFESSALRSYPLSPKFWLRYIDDILTLWPHGLKNAKTFLDHLNSIHPAISFTMEVESESKIPFLDVLILKANGGAIITDVYRKPCFTNSYFNYRSCHHPAQAVSFIKTLMHRALTVCSTEAALTNELNYIKHLAIENNFPHTLITAVIGNCVKNYRKSERVKNSTTLTPILASENQYRAALPFSPCHSFKLSKTLSKCNTRPVHVPPTKLQSLFTNCIKPAVPVLDRNGIYSIPCNCGKVYIGQTKRRLATRISEHKTCVKFQRTDISAIADHLFINDHKINWSETKILASPKTYLSRNIRESIEIFKRSSFVLNGDQGPTHINAWQDVIKQIPFRPPPTDSAPTAKRFKPASAEVKGKTSPSNNTRRKSTLFTRRTGRIRKAPLFFQAR